MKNIWKLIILTGLMLTVGLGINTINARPASANSATTAKSIRGNWYAWDKYDKTYLVKKIRAHSVVTYNQLAGGYISDYRVYTPHRSGSHKLSIRIYKHAHRGTNTVYDLNRGYLLPTYKRIGFVWSSQKSLFGHKYHVLKTYITMFDFTVYFHHKIKHDYSYTHKNYEYFIGR
ncbi:hypothetical protein YK48G_12520 [Lentilactobacillus fungorum]|uniref:Uncharacterized protein n=1 Tax=Lentilactobacillus fungorum TaxID=2201250 RepID=A0ABQ3VZU3_9LACO|nr:hypothetical protein [Lentilactobacillus fungorum]GHP13827.1 hypothetical protein YK48G_12520 [Lentilactobacillus fungorum]